MKYKIKGSEAYFLKGDDKLDVLDLVYLYEQILVYCHVF